VEEHSDEPRTDARVLFHRLLNDATNDLLRVRARFVVETDGKAISTRGRQARPEPEQQAWPSRNANRAAALLIRDKS
jgi:hypothetical protein